MLNRNSFIIRYLHPAGLEPATLWSEVTMFQRRNGLRREAKHRFYVRACFIRSAQGLRRKSRTTVPLIATQKRLQRQTRANAGASKCQCEENTHAGTRITARFFVCQETGRNLADSSPSCVSLRRKLRSTLAQVRKLLKKMLCCRGTGRLQRC